MSYSEDRDQEELPLDPEQEAWQHRANRRDFLKKSGVVLATGAGILGSQGWVGPRRVEAADTVNLRYTLWDPNQAPYMKQAIKLFTDANPKIKVTIEQYAWASYWTKVQTETAGRNAADVQWGQLAWWPGWIAQGGYYLNENKYIVRDKVDLGQYFPQLVNLWKVKGQVTSLPKDWDTICMYYNKNLLAKAGLAEPTASWTWNPKDGGDLLKYAMKLTIDHNGKTALESGFDSGKIKQYGVDSWNTSQELWMNLMWMNGATGILKAPYSNVVTIDEPQSIEVFQFLHDLNFKYHVSPPAQIFVTQGGEETSFANQTIAMAFKGSWNNNFFSTSIKNFNWGVAYLPKGPAGRVSTFNGLTHVIAASTKHPEESWQLAKHMDSLQAQKLITSAGVVFPSIKSLTGDYVKSFAHRNPTGVQRFIDETSRTGLWPVHPKWTQMFDAINTSLNAFWNNSNAKASDVIPALAKKLRTIVG
jgi:multiple sugar transport system substrate-binding protein